MPRAARRASATSLYHVVNRGSSKQIIFEDDDDRAFFMKRLCALLDENNGTLLAWCLMDNHFHLLISIAYSELSGFMHRLQTSYAGYFNRVHERCGPLFDGRFKSESVETEAYLLDVIRYIHENPVRAHLTSSLHYRWSSYSEYLGVPHYADTSFVLGLFGSKRQFEAFHQSDHVAGDCLEVAGDATERAFSDTVAEKIAHEALGIDPGAVKELNRSQRNRAIAKLRSRGLGIRQIQRLTGISLSVVSRAGRLEQGTG